MAASKASTRGTNVGWTSSGTPSKRAGPRNTANVRPKKRIERRVSVRGKRLEPKTETMASLPGVPPEYARHLYGCSLATLQADSDQTVLLLLLRMEGGMARCPPVLAREKSPVRMDTEWHGSVRI